MWSSLSTLYNDSMIIRDHVMVLQLLNSSTIEAEKVSFHDHWGFDMQIIGGNLRRRIWCSSSLGRGAMTICHFHHHLHYDHGNSNVMLYLSSKWWCFSSLHWGKMQSLLWFSWLWSSSTLSFWSRVSFIVLWQLAIALFHCEIDSFPWMAVYHLIHFAYS